MAERKRLITASRLGPIVSSAVDDDVARTFAEGRETLGSVLRAGQKHLQKVFIVFLIGFIGTFTALRLYIWDILKRDLNAHPDIVVVAITPFEVILLQAKIGLVAGALLAMPGLAYFARASLKRRGRWPEHVPRWKAVGFAGVSALLFVGGVTYAYRLFFPLMFAFLAGNAVGAGFQPTYSISMWAQFIFLLSLSFGLAAQLPLIMSTLAYSEIVAYETFRDKWKYAIVGIFAFGALFSPPDPFTQIMWAIPLVTLYGVSLYITKIVVTTKRSSDSIDLRRTAREHWNVLGGLLVAGFALVYAFYDLGGYEAVNAVLAAAGSRYRFLPAGGAWVVDPVLYLVLWGSLYGLLFAMVGLAYFVYDGLEEPEDPYAVSTGTEDPEDVDVASLDADGVREVPAEVFASLEESEALALASEAMEDDDPEKARAILDRYDDANPPESDDSPDDADAAVAEGPTADAVADADTEADADADADTAPADAAEAGDDTAAATAGSGAAAETANADASGGDDEDAGFLTQRTAGFLDSFSDDDVDEDDVGGYAYDIAFILDSLTSKSFRLFGLFMIVMGGTFFVLYQGGIGTLHEQFVSGMPDQFAADQVDIVVLHPVEALIFMIKVAVVFGLAATLPLMLYYAWPSLKERGFARGDRRVLLVWGGSLVGSMALGSVLGFLYIAPGVISWLAYDVLRADMVIAYRISHYGWLVFFLTAGIGILAMIPVSMLLFHRGRIVPYATMRDRWREFTIAVFALAAILSPRGVFTMFILGIPIAAAYGLGLGILWLYTLGGRREPQPAEPAD